MAPAAVGVTLLLAACPSTPPVQTPEAPDVQVSAGGTKVLRFAWTGGEGADSFELVRVDGAGPETVAADIPSTATTHDLEAFLPAVAGARFALRACNASGCTPSDPVDVTPHVVVAAVGYLKAGSPDEGDTLGYATAVSYDGSVLVAGAPHEDGQGTGVNPVDLDGPFGTDTGAVYVFDRSAGWSQSAYLKASNPDSVDGFGFAVAVSGDGSVVAVGAALEDGDGSGVDPTVSDSLSSAGAAYVYERDEGGAWHGPVYLKSSQPVFTEWFGASVALSEDGDVLAVGAADPFGAGAVYVFARSPVLGWTGPLRVTSDDLQAGDQFGRTVALSADGTVLAVGAPFEASSGSGVDPVDDDAMIVSGAVYVFDLEAEGGPAQVAYIKAPAPGDQDLFGWSLALSADGDVLVVGAGREDGGGSGVDPPHDDTLESAGAAYVYERGPGGVWAVAAYLKALQPGDHDRFGDSVAVSPEGSLVAVGAPLEDGSGVGVGPAPDDDTPTSGAVYLFSRDGAGGWQAAGYVKAPNTGADDQFGQSVALSNEGGLLVVGGWFEDGAGTGPGADQSDDSAENAGAVFLY